MSVLKTNTLLCQNWKDMFVPRIVKIICKVSGPDVQRRNANHLAFIGVGNMGARMATNLIKKGENLRIYDVLQSNSKTVEGAQICSTQAEAVKDASVIITMLPDSDIVKETVLGENGIVKYATKGSLIIDCSTIQPQVAQELSKITKEKGFNFLDAPVSGGVMGAEAGTLSFMIGGEKKVLQTVEPLLFKMGANIFHCGNPGTGQIAKLCNNLMVLITMIGTAEGMNLGIKMGMDPKTLASVINLSTGGSWSSSTYNPVPGINPNAPASKNYKGGFAVNLATKDLGLAENLALSCDAPVPLTAAAHQLYRAINVNGYGNKDIGSIYEFLKGTAQ